MPIVLAIIPVLAGVARGQMIFNLVFFVVVVSALLQGVSVRSFARWFRLEAYQPPEPLAALEIISTRKMQGELLTFHIHPALAVSGQAISEIPFPPETSVILIVRGSRLIAPRGAVVLLPGDHIYILCRPEDRPYIHLLFGRQAGE